MTCTMIIKKQVGTKEETSTLKLTYWKFLARIHFELWNSSFTNGHCTHHQNYPSLEIVALFPIALGVEKFLLSQT
jgi:hypothetical protein